MFQTRCILCFCAMASILANTPVVAQEIINVPPAWLNTVEPDDVVNVLPGGHLDRVQVKAGGSLNVRGGEVTALSVGSGGVAEISGGTIDTVSNWGDLRIVGGRFELNGQPVEGLSESGASAQVAIGEGILTGYFADGTPFVFTRAASDHVDELALTNVALPSPEPLDFIASVDPIPRAGLSGDQKLTLDAGQETPKFYTIGHDAFLRIEEGGIARKTLQAFGASIELDGGTLARFAEMGPGTSLLVKSGQVGRDVKIREGASITMLGGTVTDLQALPGSSTTIAGGELRGMKSNLYGDVVLAGGSYYGVRVFGNLTLSGGHVGRINGSLASSVLIEGTEFLLNGKPLGDYVDLVPGEIVDVDYPVSITLSGKLADGSPFAIGGNKHYQVKLTSLLGDFDNDKAWTSSDADHLCRGLAADVPDASLDLNRDSALDSFDLLRFLGLADSIHGDSNLDGQVDFTDFLNLSGSFGNEGSWTDGDFSCDGKVEFDDFLVLSTHFGAQTQTTSVPEPRLSFIGYILMTMLACRRARRQHSAQASPQPTQ